MISKSNKQIKKYYISQTNPNMVYNLRDFETLEYPNSIFFASYLTIVYIY